MTPRRPTRALRRAAAAVLLLPARLAMAQAGPPVVTDDPGTPGDGRWEINLAAIAERRGGWTLSAPDADLNYGWGERVQLKLDVPWTFVRDSGGAWRSGLGEVEAGIKWRFLDGGEDGLSMSVYPQYASAWSRRSRRRGIASPDAELSVPVEFSRTFGAFEIAAEAGRDIIEREPDEWAAGLVAAHACGRALECVGEIRRTWQPGRSATLLNLGLRWTLAPRVLLLAAAGRSFGAQGPEPQEALFYLGVQILR